MNNNLLSPNRISLEQNYEIRYWTQKLSCTREELRRAVQKVGACVTRVQQELTK